jgi:prolyl-tRNA synthetase
MFYLKQRIDKSIFLLPTNESEIIQIVNDFKTKYFQGDDEIRLLHQA